MAAYQYIYVMKGLSKTYPGGREVLKDIYLSFFPGAKIGVLGPNGAGKSTLLKIMAGGGTGLGRGGWAPRGGHGGIFHPGPGVESPAGAPGRGSGGVAGAP